MIMRTSFLAFAGRGGRRLRRKQAGKPVVTRPQARFACDVDRRLRTVGKMHSRQSLAVGGREALEARYAVRRQGPRSDWRREDTPKGVRSAGTSRAARRGAVRSRTLGRRRPGRSRALCAKQAETVEAPKAKGRGQRERRSGMPGQRSAGRHEDPSKRGVPQRACERRRPAKRPSPEDTERSEVRRAERQAAKGGTVRRRTTMPIEAVRTSDQVTLVDKPKVCQRSEREPILFPPVVWRSGARIRWDSCQTSP